MELEAGENYTELSATATDSFDQNLPGITIDSSAINNTVPGDYVVTYNVSDASNNQAITKMRTVTVVDNTAPVITLNGSASIVHEAGTAYTDLGATWADAVDGSGDAVIGGDTVDSNTLGSYTVRYTKSDSAGNAATEVTRLVTVSDNTKPVITLNGSATVELEAGENYTELGATATDSFDQNLPGITICLLYTSDAADE